jgi:hypothetical protein
MKRFGVLAVVVAGICLIPATAASASTGFFPYSNPSTPASPSYTGITCKIDFSSIAEGTPLTSVSGCGVTVTFSVTMYKENPGSQYIPTTWGSPGNVEPGSPDVLFASASTVTMTYHTPGPSGAGRRTVGVEVGGGLFNSTDNFTATFNGAGGPDGTVYASSTPDFGTLNGDAKLLAARTKTIPKVTSLTISDSGCCGFAIGSIRV